MVKAIETQYKGYRFRSRLEARWAVFFDVLGIKWVYEPQGYDLGQQGYYLPDFWLPDQKYWFECKSQAPTPAEILKGVALASATDHHFIIATEIPEIKSRSYGSPPINSGNLYWIWPRTDTSDSEYFGGLQWIYNSELGYCVGGSLGETIEQWNLERNWELHSTDSEYLAILRAYEIAKSARFEHGENPLLSVAVYNKTEEQIAKTGEIIYKGNRFHDTLDARYAVFFDTLGCKWEYAAFHRLANKYIYLPGFYLPELRFYVEIKQTSPSHREESKLREICDSTSLIGCIMWGSIPPTGILMLCNDIGESSAGAYITNDASWCVCSNCLTPYLDPNDNREFYYDPEFSIPYRYCRCENLAPNTQAVDTAYRVARLVNF